MKKWLVILILAVSQFVMVLDSTVMNVSISTVAKDLGTNISGMQTAITFYTLTMAALMLTGGKLGNIWGRHNAFRIGSVVYGIGSLITALAPSLAVLMFGWSFVEGLGAILVIPAIAALAAINYTGKDRVVAFSILGAVGGLAAAVGPIIGGFVTTYLSWRYVFAAETAVMAIVLVFAGRVHDVKETTKAKLDIPSVLLSATGMGLLVFGVLQSKNWGWLIPKASPTVNGQVLAPLGISLVAYLIVLGVMVLNWFMSRQRQLEKTGGDPLLKVSLLSKPILRSGLGVLLSQYFIIASLFFVVPVYLQTVLGYDALQTGLKLIPLSIGLIIFSAVGSKLSSSRSPRWVTRVGQISMAVGALFVMGSITPELKSVLFWVGMFIIGSGLGLLASQLGNVNMSAVDKRDTAEVGGLQGTYQNLGSSFGTALVGSVFMLTLTSGFTNAISNNPNLSTNTKNQIVAESKQGIQIVSAQQAEQYVLAQGASATTAQTITSDYQQAQIDALRQATFFIFASAMLALVLSRNLPNKKSA